MLNLKNLAYAEMQLELSRLGGRPAQIQQVFRDLHRTYGQSIEKFNISKELTAKLAEVAMIPSLRLEDRLLSADQSEKFTFVSDKGRLEAVSIPYENRLTVCVSSQVGCALDCGFCLTGLLPYKGNLEAWEIVEQVEHIQSLSPDKKVTNVVFMGMGEPLLNYEHAKKAVDILTSHEGLGIGKSKITVSTAGYIPHILKWGQEVGTHLAVSVIAATDEKRSKLMNINRQFPLKDLVKTIKDYTEQTGKKVFCEYLLIENLTDQPSDAKELSNLFSGLDVTLNLIPYNNNDQLPFKRPTKEHVAKFKDWLYAEGLFATVRWSHGLDVGAACGQLAG